MFLRYNSLSLVIFYATFPRIQGLDLYNRLCLYYFVLFNIHVYRIVCFYGVTVIILFCVIIYRILRFYSILCVVTECKTCSRGLYGVFYLFVLLPSILFILFVFYLFLPNIA